jgi:predicted nucleotidyltransferase
MSVTRVKMISNENNVIWEHKHMNDMNSSTLDRIRDVLTTHKEELKEKYGVIELGIFGSFVRGENKKDSDLDILVEFEEDPGIGLITFVNMENYLSDLLGIKVDLVEKSSLKPRIGRYILKEVLFL